MGFMENLRRNVFGVFGTIILFIILILFLWGDASQGGAGQLMGGPGEAGAVNGEEITFEEFELAVDEAIAGMPGEDINRDSVREQVWEQLVQQKLLYQAAEQYGIAVSDEELAAMLFTSPPQQLAAMFTDSSGSFMQDMYNSFMRDMDGFFAAQQVPEATAEQLRKTVLASQRQMRLQATVARMFDLVGSLYPRSTTLLRAAYNEQNTTASGEFIFLSANLIPDAEIEVTDAEIEEYYSEHVDMYRRKASRIAQYAVLRLGPSSKDSQKVGARFNRYAEEMQKAGTMSDSSEAFGRLVNDFGPRLMTGNAFKPLHELPAEVRDTIASLPEGAIIGPVRINNASYFVNLVDVRDSGTLQVKASHILLQSPEENDSALSMAEDIARQAREGGDWASLVTQYSQDPGSAGQGGSVGWVTESTNYVEPFKKAVLGGQTGEIIGPVRSEFGYHIIRIEDRSEKAYKVRALNFDIEISQTTRQQLQRKAQRLKERTEEGEDFEKVAEELELQVLESAPITHGNLQIAGTPRIASFAYDAELGEVSDVIRMPDESYIVARLSQINQGGPAPLEDVRDQIDATIRNRKKVEKLQARAASVRSGLGSGTDLSVALASDSTLVVRQFTDISEQGSFPDVGNDVLLASKVFSMSPGQVSDPIRGERGYYIVRLDSLNRKDDAAWTAEKEEFIKGMIGQRRQMLFGAWFDEYRNAATVVRNWK